MKDPQKKKSWQSMIGISIFTLFVLSSIVVNESVQALNQAAGNYGYYGGTYGFGGSTNSSVATSDSIPNTPGSQAVGVGSGQAVVSWTAVTTTELGTSYDNHSSYRVVYGTTSASVLAAYSSNNGSAALPSGTSVWTSTDDSGLATRGSMGDTIRTTITGLTNGTTYFFAAYACDTRVNCSDAPSAAVSGAPAAGTTSSGGGGGGSGGGTTTPGATTYPNGTGAPSAPAAPAVPGGPSRSAATLENMAADSALMASGTKAEIMAAVGATENLAAEAQWSAKMTSVMGTISDANIRNRVLWFTVYGTPTTLFLGAGERLGVVNSYRTAFKRFPSTNAPQGTTPGPGAHWFDAIKIGHGRWPGERNLQAEEAAKARFRVVYLRTPNMASPYDNAHVTIIAYGLRPKPRNLNSERAAIAIFRGIFKKSPVTAFEWDTMRAIAYSGAKR